jgi:hypothetical protein
MARSLFRKGGDQQAGLDFEKPRGRRRGDFAHVGTVMARVSLRWKEHVRCCA